MDIAKRKTLGGYLSAVGCEVFFGFSYLFTKQATNQASTLALLGWRFALAATVMGLCASAGLIRLRLRSKPVKPLIPVALFCPILYFLCETEGISRTTVCESGTIIASIPMACLTASALILHDRPRRIQVLGILTAFSGVLISVFTAGAEASFSASGYAMLAAAVVSYALYSVFVEKAREHTGVEVTFAMLASGAVVFGALAVAEAALTGNLTALLCLPLTDRPFLMAVLYQGIGCSVLAFFMWNVAVARIGVNRAASFIGIATLVSILSGVFLLHESISVARVLGACLIIAGVYVANLRIQW